METSSLDMRSSMRAAKVAGIEGRVCVNANGRIAQLEAIIEGKKNSMSKTGFRSWRCRASEVFELATLKSHVDSRKQVQVRSNGGWHDDPASRRQIEYLNSLGVRLEDGMTKGRASELIEAARGGYLGTVSGFYRDGSN